MNKTEYRRKRKKELIDLLGGKCVMCGSKNNLEFDHIDKSKKEHKITRILEYSMDRIMQELNKCQLLCKECHLEKTSLNSENTLSGPARHGTLHMYRNYKCRCDECKKAASNYYHNSKKIVIKVTNAYFNMITDLYKS